VTRWQLPEKTRVFFQGKLFGQRQKPWLYTEKKIEGTSSAIFGIGTAATQAMCRLSSLEAISSPPKRELSTLSNFLCPFKDIRYFSQFYNFSTVEQSFC